MEERINNVIQCVMTEQHKSPLLRQTIFGMVMHIIFTVYKLPNEAVASGLKLVLILKFR